jgi:hypothetical protein
VVETTDSGIERHKLALDIWEATKMPSPGGVGIGFGSARLGNPTV